MAVALGVYLRCMNHARFAIAAAVGSLVLVTIFVPRTRLHAENEGDVVVMSTDGAEISRFTPFAGKPVGSVALADLGHDGIDEVILGSGVNQPPTVNIYRQDGSSIISFPVYDAGFTGGVNVAACDLDGDDAAEIITGAQWSGGPHVRIFHSDGTVAFPGFFAYDAAFRGGVNVACGDVDGDGANDIVTGPGLTGGPHIRVFTASGSLMHEVFNGSALQNTGAFVAVADLDNDDNAEIVASSMGVDATSVSAFDVADDEFAFRSTVSSSSTYGMPEFAFDTNIVLSSLSPFTTSSPLRAASSNGTLVVAQSTNALHDDVSVRSILVDISDQQLTAFEYGVPVKQFLVSTGLRGFDTPLGKTDVKEKLLWHDYAWYYGAGDARNYNIPNVKYNLRIHKHIYIHYAYWHNQFGTRRSHGCVNVNYENSEWIFNWANVGTPVNIVP